MLKASLSGDTTQAVSLKVCLITCLASQLELHRLPGLYHDDSRQKVVNGANEIIGLTRGFKDEESSLLCPILGVRKDYTSFSVLRRVYKCSRHHLLVSGVLDSGGYSASPGKTGIRRHVQFGSRR